MSTGDSLTNVETAAIARILTIFSMGSAVVLPGVTVGGLMPAKKPGQGQRLN